MKKIIFFYNFRGGAPGATPPGTAPAVIINIQIMLHHYYYHFKLISRQRSKQCYLVMKYICIFSKDFQIGLNSGKDFQIG